MMLKILMYYYKIRFELHRLLHYDDRVLDLVSQWKRFQDEQDTSNEFIKFVYKVLSPLVSYDLLLPSFSITSNISKSI